ncbi:MAG: hypothetical protein KJ904_06105 [Alphaproteobacteria bacterium]|nr:hypothetical protein [Alphaproteobacteria bacterium]MBU0798474.1 hypothetical protein [Alphaproteobacteria bacterium]MBU0886719.1 hypothetical protein [Alphaproteobacteria bacterium]MBU1812553.1 hypothetical protein [Alphaproteobacteria bacterium]MBU2091998.1 hypothetical protein [Alphaproteobacteria bacterium]
MSKKDVEIIHPTNTIKQYVNDPRALNPAAVAKAEAAMAKFTASIDLASEAEPALQDMQAAYQAMVAQPQDCADPAKRIYNLAHDLRGLGASFNYPLITRIGGSLCRFIDGLGQANETQLEIVRAHVDAIRAVMHNQMKGEGHAIGTQIAEGLETLVREER